MSTLQLLPLTKLCHLLSRCWQWSAVMLLSVDHEEEVFNNVLFSHVIGVFGSGQLCVSVAWGRERETDGGDLCPQRGAKTVPLLISLFLPPSSLLYLLFLSPGRLLPTNTCTSLFDTHTHTPSLSTWQCVRWTLQPCSVLGFVLRFHTHEHTHTHICNAPTETTVCLPFSLRPPGGSRDMSHSPSHPLSLSLSPSLLGSALYAWRMSGWASWDERG